MKKIYLLILCMSLFIVACGEAGSQEEDSSSYPERDINITIPYASGGGGDFQARIIGNYLQEEMGVTVNVEARPGGAGSTGMNYINTADPDGYNIILTAVGPSTLTPNHNEVGYNVVDNFEQISQVTFSPYGMAVNSSSGIESLEELFELAGQEGEVTYGTTGSGLHQHVVTSALLNNMDGATMEHVPFEGGAEALNALLGSHTTASMNTLSEIIPHHGDGLNILAVTAEERLEELPEVPTFSELGYDLISQGAWFGFMAPKDTPSEIIDILDQNISAALEDEEIINRFTEAGYQIEYLGPEEFATKVAEEDESNRAVIEELNLN
ncbi:tripartite tricarboxylate transporter substrate binding protein [Salinicoccus sp. YB14-2]|uniref:tripartite tricarboxylate transporter substrate binding protein n=1 Tax=Salinicoccus sp. YB14-2 TaxID=1572701 RepID=UPI00068F8D72|nr:tripartite tricarboxylate transporter substrate binding protein [Salinicoccus sp. YB14-2]